MNNREWMNGLSDKEIAEFISSFGQECVCCPLDKTCDGACVARITNWLSEPHETTGHEDLVNAGWKPWDSDEQSVYYEKGSRRIRILKYGYNHYCGEDYVQFSDEEIDFIRKCADKIRKEKGWA